jgi:CubicO group peptidase (beta-lactamase class C family)
MSELEDAIAEAAAPHIGPDKIPGLVAGVAQGDDRTIVALGNLDVEPGRPARRDSLFRLASATKPIAGAAAMAAIDDGLMTLEEPVDRLLPELADRRVLRRIDGPLDDTVAAERPITVRDVLSFTLGFGMVTEMFMADEPWPILAADKEPSLGTWMVDPARDMVIVVLTQLMFASSAGHPVHAAIQAAARADR